MRMLGSEWSTPVLQGHMNIVREGSDLILTEDALLLKLLALGSLQKRMAELVLNLG